MKSTRNERLLVWSLATFHTAFFLAVLITLIYASGALGALLGNLNTIIGLLLFGALWVTTGWTTSNALSQLKWTIEESVDFIKMLGLSFVWGGANGFLFFVILLLMQIAPALLINSATQPAVLGALILIGGIGSGFAFIIGGFFGLVFAVVDFTILESSRRAFWFLQKTDSKVQTAP